ncbi:hypothetical protein ACIRD0_37240 [Streptomyces microflavus]|uniref:hypothetical protein n=1 Tax=Streptomyces microflavus TaxID=1919 RepID=UPI00382DBFB5
MTSLDRTTGAPPFEARLLAWLTVVTALLSIVAAFILAVNGHSDVATAVAAVGGAVGVAGGIRVIVQIKN